MQSPYSIMKLRTTLSILLITSIVFIDQLIKYSVKTGMCLYDKIRVTDWFYIFFTENKGMAFGWSFVATDILTVFRMVAIAAFVYILVREIRKQAPVGFIICLSLVIAGALGNIIDNCLYGLIFTESFPAASPLQSPATLVEMGKGYSEFLHGRVVDMFYFPLFTWPDSMPLVGGSTFFGAVFNFADAAISCGGVAILLFYYRYISKLMGSTSKSTMPNE